MIAYKVFHPGLICRGYQFVMGMNKTDKVKCVGNGFHCAEDPLDCLSYYPDIKGSEYHVANAGGDIDEDGNDSKIAFTKRLTREELFLHGLAYMVDHPQRKYGCHIAKDYAKARGGYAVVRGVDPAACGDIGDILAFAKEDPLAQQTSPFR